MELKSILTKSIVGLVAVALLAFFMPGQLRGADEIKLGILSTGGDDWPIWVALDQGYFKEQNLELREFQTNSIAKAIQALSAN